MPTYEYECPRHGPFDAIRSMSEASAPHSCPECGAQAPRVVLTAAAVAGMPAARRNAYQVNERSAHEPKTSASLRHAPGCGCCSPGRKKSTTLALPDGSKTFPSKRPWMIGH